MDLMSGLTLSHAYVPLALTVLAANSFVQPQSSWCQLLAIEHKTFRLLRILPFIAFVDACVCLLTLLGFCNKFKRNDSASVHQSSTEAEPAAAESEPMLVQDEPEKKTSEKVDSSWDRIFVCVRSSPKAVLAFVAWLMLLYLTWSEGSTFSCFCGCAFFMSYGMNAIADKTSYSYGDDKSATLPVQADSSAKPKPNPNTPGIIQWLGFILVVGLAIQFMHVAWLSQYLVPRTLWMDWGPHQIADTDHSNLTFVIPPGMPPPTSHQLQSGKDLVVGFWPSHSFTGSTFYSISVTVMALVMSFGGTFFIAMPFFMVSYTIWVGVLFALGYLIYILFLRIKGPVLQRYYRFKDTVIGGNMISWASALVAKLAEPHKIVLYMIFYPVYGIGFVLAVIVWTGFAMAPVMLMSRGFIPLDPFDILGSRFVTNFFFATLDYPQGSYASLTGTCFALSIIALRQIVPIVQGRRRAEVSTDEKRHWTALWTVLVVSITSLFYYLVYADTKGVLV